MRLLSKEEMRGLHLNGKKDHLNSKMLFLALSLAALAALSIGFNWLVWLGAFLLFSAVYTAFLSIRVRIEKKKAISDFVKSQITIVYHIVSLLTALILLFVINIPLVRIGFTTTGILPSLAFTLLFSLFLLGMYVVPYLSYNRKLPSVSKKRLFSIKRFLHETFGGINEEMWFRGIILGLLIPVYGPVFSIILSSVFFMLMHLKSNWMSRIWALGMGLGFGAIMVITGNLIGLIFGHVFFNFMTASLEK